MNLSLFNLDHSRPLAVSAEPNLSLDPHPPQSSVIVPASLLGPLASGSHGSSFES